MKIQERTGAGGGRSSMPAPSMSGERLPTPPRERKPALAALAVLLILVGALGATMLVLRAGDRIEVVKVTKAIPAGGLTTAHLIARDAPHPVAAHLDLQRFAAGRTLDERGAGPFPYAH